VINWLREEPAYSRSRTSSGFRRISGFSWRFSGAWRYRGARVAPLLREARRNFEVEADTTTVSAIVGAIRVGQAGREDARDMLSVLRAVGVQWFR